MSDLYRELILDHWRNPRHAEPLAQPTHRATVRNESCGDEATVELVVDSANQRLAAVGVQVSGCALSTAAGSVLAEQVAGQPLTAVRRLRVNDLKRLMGAIEPSLSRENCVRIGFEAFSAALNQPQLLND